MDQKKMLGFKVPGDEKIPVAVRDWSGMKLALWRSKVAWEIAAREAAGILDGCEHANGCPGEEDETQPCLPERWEKRAQLADETDEAYAQVAGVLVQKGCLDRELRMSALVILNAARMFAPIDARRPAVDQYMAPSREYFSEVIAELGTAQVEIDVLREALQAAGVPIPSPASVLTEPAPPLQLEELTP
jgi:hypothetical protein